MSEKKRLEVVDWNKPPDKLKSCYYYYNGLFQQESLTTRPQAVEALLRQYPDLTFHTEHEFGYRTLMNCPESTVLRYALAPVDLSYLELNKDNPGTMEGSVVSAQYGQTYHELAKQLAIQDTLRTWQLFEKGVRKKYGSRADSILLSLKLGKPSSDY